MGVSVFNAAVTTMCSAIVMMNSYILFFKKFGIFIFLNIAYSTVFAFILLMAILMLVGPIQGAGKLSTLCDDGKDGDGMVSNPMRKSADSLPAGKGVVQNPADEDEDLVGEPV